MHSCTIVTDTHTVICINKSAFTIEENEEEGSFIITRKPNYKGHGSYSYFLNTKLEEAVDTNNDDDNVPEGGILDEDLYQEYHDMNSDLDEGIGDEDLLRAEASQDLVMVACFPLDDTAIDDRLDGDLIDLFTQGLEI